MVGSRPILLVGDVAFLTDEQGRLLMNLRPDNHLWGIPGGTTELGESVEVDWVYNPMPPVLG